MESSEPWYHRLEVRGIQYDIGGDSTVGTRVGEDFAIADKALFRAWERGRMWWRVARVAPWSQEEGPGEKSLTTLGDRKPYRIREEALGLTEVG